MGTLPTEHTERVKKFIREEDRKRGLISRLLQFAACREVYGMAQEDIVIKRTKVGVPRGASSSAKRVGSSTIFCRRVFAEAFFAPRLPLTSRPAPPSFQGSLVDAVIHDNHKHYVSYLIKFAKHTNGVTKPCERIVI